MWCDYSSEHLEGTYSSDTHTNTQHIHTHIHTHRHTSSPPLTPAEWFGQAQHGQERSLFSKHNIHHLNQPKSHTAKSQSTSSINFRARHSISEEEGGFGEEVCRDRTRLSPLAVWGEDNIILAWHSVKFLMKIFAWKLGEELLQKVKKI